jgi:hypothetical protein
VTAGARVPFSLWEKVSDEVRRMRVGAKRRWLKTAAETLIRPRPRRVHLLPEGEGGGDAASFVPTRTVR